LAAVNGDNDFPFFWVQLANFMKAETIAFPKVFGPELERGTEQNPWRLTPQPAKL
jgi:hypothetical protein